MSASGTGIDLIFCPESTLLSDAGQLAEHLAAPVVQNQPDAADAALYLRLDSDGLTLCGGGQEMRGDLTHLLPRLKHNNLTSELLVKAAKLRGSDGRLTAVDATAGMGEDSLLLAAAGWSVRLYEADPVIAALLRDTLRRSSEIPELSGIVSRMELIEGDSIAAMQALPFRPDVIVLDPMFPERQKTGLVKKKFQLIHQLEQPCSDEAALLSAALAAHPKRIVIKRPLKGPYLAGVKPAYSLTGKAIRYDCIVPPAE